MYCRFVRVNLLMAGVETHLHASYLGKGVKILAMNPKGREPPRALGEELLSKKGFVLRLRSEKIPL